MIVARRKKIDDTTTNAELTVSVNGILADETSQK